MKRRGYSLIFLLTLIAVVAALCAALFPTVAGHKIPTDQEYQAYM